MAYVNVGEVQSTTSPQAPKTPATNELLAETLGHINRGHKLAGELELRLFGDGPPDTKNEASMPDAVAWKAHAAHLGSMGLADRLAVILNRL